MERPGNVEALLRMAVSHLEKVRNDAFRSRMFKTTPIFPTLHQHTFYLDRVYPFLYSTTTVVLVRGYT